MVIFNQHLLQPGKQFRTLFNYSEVSREISVKHGVKSKLPECGDHFACHPFTRVITKVLTQGYPDCRGCLYNHMFVSVIYCIPYLVNIGLFRQGSCRAAVDALAAVGAHNMAHGPVME